MKRVHNHNEPGPTKSAASGSPPPSGSTKGKKRKTSGGNQQSKFIDKAPKRVNTPPVPVRQPRGPSLDERYNEKYQALLSTVELLKDPMNAGNHKLISNIEDTLKVMTQTKQRMQPPAMGQDYNQFG